eukprot:CAMPEP_0206143364 /NCGR_PEP_ID=MMETSP1473-20131121/20286_1 /ASSEMBLY_ACC=CAM_ASM_001109 /TAXON_ID=1461547 /ORGANISM="Stichococcus sp, Strain RCC1054" /LENGTH=41 /DNA_ID= /DNA_START= /DNA_END= /DNA_ORIENTATION=
MHVQSDRPFPSHVCEALNQEECGLHSVLGCDAWSKCMKTIV